MVEVGNRTWGPQPTERVAYPVMYQSWNVITFLHWRYDASDVQRVVPSPLKVETFDGSAWIGLTPFLLENLRTPIFPSLPWLSRFPETNVRTYVRGPDGRPGIWFLALDTPRLAGTLFARSVYFLPYNWAGLELERNGETIHYRGRRRWPNGSGEYDVGVEVGDAYDPTELGDLDHFLTARWVLFTLYGRVVASASAEHPPWPLRRSRALHWRESVLEGVGLPPPSGDPLVHFSWGVDTRISAPRPVSPPR